jgi:signal transduction histidine kinase
MNFWTGLHFFCFIIYVFCIFYIIIKNPYAVANWVLSVLFACFALWSICNAIIYNTGTSVESAALAVRIQSVAWAGFITYYFIFLLFLTNNRKFVTNPFILTALNLIPGIFIYQAFSGNMLACCEHVSFGLTATWKNTVWTFLYYAYYSAMFLWGTFILYRFFSSTRIRTEKTMAGIMLLSAIAVFAFGTLISVIFKQLGLFLPLDANVTFLIFTAGLIYCAEKFEFMSLTGTRIADMIMDSINEGLVLLNREGEVLSANRAAFDILGLSESTDAEFLTIPESIGAGGPADFEIEFRTPQKQTKNLVISSRKLDKSAGRSERVCIIRDVTKRKKAEKELVSTIDELKRSNEELESFAYVASHDLKEPLRMVASYMQLLEKKSRDKFGRDELDYMGFASDGAMRMNELIEDLLEYSRVNTRGREFIETDLNETVSRVRDMMKFRIQDKKGRVEAAGRLPVIMADSIQMEQLFQNIIDNALKFSGKEPPLVTISAVKKDRVYEFAVRDNGIGLDMQYKDRIFQVFQRLHGREEYDGTGIGLAICKKIIERHHGKIWVESDGEGRGSTFFFTLPA